MAPIKHTRVRVYQSLRSAHLERAHQAIPASIIYGERRYDFDDGVGVGLDLVPAGVWKMARILVGSVIETVEINEPLQRPGLRRTAVAVIAVRLGAALRRRSISVVTYAIENRNPFTVRADRTFTGRLRTVLDRQLSRLVAWNVDRIVFGTDGSRELYRAVLSGPLRRSAQSTIPALPARCACTCDQIESADGSPLDGVVLNVPNEVLFVGAFESRKGVSQLLDAWPLVTDRLPTAELTMVGSGTLEPMVRDFASHRRNVRVVVDPPRTEIHRLLRHAAVLVLLSQPTNSWREQVGLPIVEGLAHGSSILATSQTGLAEWLQNHQHEIVVDGEASSEIAARIVEMVIARRPPESVMTDLPAVDGRLDADEWLFRPLPTDRAFHCLSNRTGPGNTDE